jgi:ubiquinone/menaquinone biosynthesis C-methylase UbiE
VENNNVNRNWGNSAKSYDSYIQEELSSFKRSAWQEKVLKNAPPKEKLTILDVGTGPGFFPLILSEKGHCVTGIDMAKSMLEKARENLKMAKLEATILEMDATEIDFPDESFDLIISRNVTWTLDEPKKAYREWLRLLKKSGRLLVFDSNWFFYYYDNEAKRKVDSLAKEYEERYKKPHDTFTYEQQRDAYRLTRPLSREKRPEWDQRLLAEIGFKDVIIEENIMIRAEK